MVKTAPGFLVLMFQRIRNEKKVMAKGPRPYDEPNIGPSVGASIEYSVFIIRSKCNRPKALRWKTISSRAYLNF